MVEPFPMTQRSNVGVLTSSDPRCELETTVLTSTSVKTNKQTKGDTINRPDHTNNKFFKKQKDKTEKKPENRNLPSENNSEGNRHR